MDRSVTLSESAKTMDDVLRYVLIKEGTDEVKYRKLSESFRKDITGDMLSKMLRSVKDKALKMDYTEVEKTGGDITRLHNYNDLVNSISFLGSMYSQSPHGAPEDIPELEIALKNLIRFRNEFQIGIRQENELISILYNNLATALIGATSFLVATTVEYVKDSLSLYKAVFKKHMDAAPENNLFLSNLRKFNRYAERGTMKSFFEDTVGSGQGFSIGTQTPEWIKKAMGLGAKGVMMVASVALIIWSIREIVYFYYNFRNGVSGQMKHLSTFVEINATNLEKDRKSVKDKQQRIAQHLADLSDKVSVDNKIASKRAIQELKGEEREITMSSVHDQNNIL